MALLCTFRQSAPGSFSLRPCPFRLGTTLVQTRALSASESDSEDMDDGINKALVVEKTTLAIRTYA